MSNSVDPKRGDIWLVNLDPTRGQEINKTRPAAVISSDNIRTLRLRLVAPITGWKNQFAQSFWHVRLIADNQNQLDKNSAADLMQTRSLSLNRFVKQIGRVHEGQLDSMAVALAAVTEYH